MTHLIRGWPKHLTPPVPGWQRTDPLDRELVGEWRFDCNTGLILPDYSGRGNYGTITLEVAGSWEWVGARYGMALYLDPALAFRGYYVNVPDGPALDGMAALTVEVFSYNSSTAPSTHPRIVDKGSCYTIAYRTADGKYFSSVYTAAGNTEWVQTVASLDVWNHFVLTYDGATQQDYINGVTGSSDNIAGNINDNANSLFLGTSAAQDQYFEGFIGLVRIYRCALTAAEVRARYQICLKRAQPMTHVWMMPWGMAPVAPPVGPFLTTYAGYSVPVG